MKESGVLDLLYSHNKIKIKTAINEIRNDGRKKTLNMLLDFCKEASVNTVSVFMTNFLDLQNKNLDNKFFKKYNDVLPLFKDVNSVRLFNNKLTKIPKFLYELENLISLDLNQNQIKKIYKKDTDGLSNLQELHLNSNELTDLPETFNNLSELRVLSLNFNPITTFPNIILELHNLDSLVINKKQIKYLKSDVKEFLEKTGWEKYYERCLQRRELRIKKEKALKKKEKKRRRKRKKNKQ